MSVTTGTFNQIIKATKTFGGTKVVFEGHPSLLVGGFNFNLDDLPAAGDVLPCGTPVNCNEETRVITPVITIKVLSVSGSTVTVADNGFAAPAVKVGDKVGIIPSDLSSALEYYVSIDAINGNEVTLHQDLPNLAAGSILVVLDSTTHKVKAVPNALLPYDVVRDENAVSVDGDGMWANDRPILERRMPPVNTAIKTALANAGCNFKWSDRK